MELEHEHLPGSSQKNAQFESKKRAEDLRPFPPGPCLPTHGLQVTNPITGALRGTRSEDSGLRLRPTVRPSYQQTRFLNRDDVRDRSGAISPISVGLDMHSPLTESENRNMRDD